MRRSCCWERRTMPCLVALVVSFISCVSCWSTLPSSVLESRRRTVSKSQPQYRRIIQQLNNNNDIDNESKASSTKNKEGPAIPVRRLLLSYTLAAGTEYVLSQNFVRPGFKRLHPMQFFAA
mmetsp:Transcript_8095/g.13675  ORF Transcript_8095/g.13675 Transcript_8095/m.13675 type:complete len:121 (-) Transcript_8095:586-948(-)